MIRHNAGGCVGAEITATEAGGVSIYNSALLPRSDNLRQYLLIALQDSWHIHHLGETQYTLIGQEGQEVVGHEHAIGTFK